MALDHKIFVGLKSTRKKVASSPEATGPKCQWDGCERAGVHRAPVGRGSEGLYLLFCLEHVTQYNRGYSFTTRPVDADVARYQKEAASGARATLGNIAKEATQTPLPFTVRSGSAKSLNARKNAAKRQAHIPNAQQRKLKALEAKAFDTLGLPPGATPGDIRKQYKERLKMYHPDANEGDRASEAQLQASIEAYKILKINGFC